MKWVLRIAIMSTIVYSLCGCGGGSQDAPNTTAKARIIDWQAREASCAPAIWNTSGDTDTDTLLDTVTALVYATPVHYVKDTQEYWQTSCETSASMQGDCEDQAIYWYARLRATGTVPADRMVLVWLGPAPGETSGHVVLRIEADDDDIYVSSGWVFLGNHWQQNPIVAEWTLFDYWL